MEEVGMIFGIIFIPVGILIAICCIGVAAQRKKIDNTPSTRSEAKVLSKRTEYSGTGAYKVYTYHVLFQLENGGRIEYPVNANWYNKLVVGDTGILVNRGKYFTEFLWQ